VKSVRRVVFMAVVMVMTLIPTALPAVAAPAELSLSEVRIDQPSTDTDEYFELVGTPGASLDGVTYLVIGDGSGGSGVIEAVVSLDGLSIPGDGVLVVAESTFTMGTADYTVNLNFENSDNVTHLLVEDFTGSNGDDLDTDDDGTLDSEPWSSVIDAVSLVETPTAGEHFYGSQLGFVDVGPDGSYVPGHVFRDESGDWQIGDFNGGADTPGVFPNVVEQPAPQCDVTELTLISAVQGPGSSSSMEGSDVTIEGSVTAVYPDLSGIAVQEEPIDDDGDPATSEGVFVHVGSGFDFSGLSRFDIVQVTGEVDEYYGDTEIDAGEIAVCDSAPVEITPTPFTLPADFSTRESLEGTLVVTTQDLTVTSLYTAWAYGELGVSSSGILREPTSVYRPGSSRALALEQANAEDLLFIDDRGEFGYDNSPWFGEPDQRAGDIVETGVQGVLYYSFDDHLLEPIEIPEVIDGSPRYADREPAPSLRGGNDVGSFNVLNYFNTFGDSDVLRGARNQAQFDVQSPKIVQAILNLDASVLGLVELENDYEDLYDGNDATEPSIQTLVGQLNDAAGAETYDWIRVPEALLTDEGLGGGGLGPDAIAVGIIYQLDRATPVGDVATFDIDALLTGADTDKNRWPLAASFEIDGRVVTVVVNHFKSKGSVCDDVIVPAGYGDGQDDPQTANCDLVREYAAQRLIQWIRTKPTGVRSPDTLVVGDLNSYAEEDPIRIFQRAGYLDLIDRYDHGAFTYKFDGRYGRLDYLLASPSARRLVDDAEAWHLNSPEPYGYLYFNEHIDLTSYASSDHDAVVAALSKARGWGHGRIHVPRWGRTHRPGRPRGVHTWK
jgi:predicted extracellular nuclease